METQRFKDGDFRKSSLCGWSNSCVEVAIGLDIVAVRNTSDPQKRVVRFTPDEWGTFIEGVKKGEFDAS